MAKWKCHNCGNIFESEKGSEYDDFDEHIHGCFDVDDFFEIIADTKKQKQNIWANAFK